MARIRSIHPEQWSDEDFVGLSFAARLLCIAIRNECDDKGVFRWKPLTIKMKLFPGDSIDVEPLLQEMVEADLIRRFEVGGKGYGAVRNFRVFQRPKKPNDVFPMPDNFRTYVGLKQDSSEPGGNRGGTGGEIAPQMEDGGVTDTSVSGASAPSRPLDEIIFQEGLAFMIEGGVDERPARSMLGKWRKEHGAEALITALGRAKREGAIDRVAFIQGCFRSKGKRRSEADDRFATLMGTGSRDEPEAGCDVAEGEGDIPSRPLLAARAIGR